LLRIKQCSKVAFINSLTPSKKSAAYGLTSAAGRHRLPANLRAC
jgi:hypothetical protein